MEPFDTIVPAYDWGMWPLEVLALRRLRRRAFSGVEGRILELGVGTGVNLPLYGPGARIVALDASRSMLEIAGQRAARAEWWAVQADVQHLPFADGSFETVGGSLLFCSVDDPARGLAEVWRALAMGGRLLLLEHTRGRGLGAWLTDLLHPLWYAWNGVCHLNRRTAQAVAAAGFRLVRDEAHALGILRVIEGLKPATPKI